MRKSREKLRERAKLKEKIFSLQEQVAFRLKENLIHALFEVWLVVEELMQSILHNCIQRRLLNVNEVVEYFIVKFFDSTTEVEELQNVKF